MAKKFEEHIMYSPDGKSEMANTYENHLRLKEMGWSHEPISPLNQKKNQDVTSRDWFGKAYKASGGGGTAGGGFGNTGYSIDWSGIDLSKKRLNDKMNKNEEKEEEVPESETKVPKDKCPEGSKCDCKKKDGYTWKGGKCIADDETEDVTGEDSSACDCPKELMGGDTKDQNGTCYDTCLEECPDGSGDYNPVTDKFGDGAKDRCKKQPNVKKEGECDPDTEEWDPLTKTCKPKSKGRTKPCDCGGTTFEIGINDSCAKFCNDKKKEKEGKGEEKESAKKGEPCNCFDMKTRENKQGKIGADGECDCSESEDPAAAANEKKKEENIDPAKQTNGEQGDCPNPNQVWDEKSQSCISKTDYDLNKQAEDQNKANIQGATEKNPYGNAAEGFNTDFGGIEVGDDIYFKNGSGSVSGQDMERTDHNGNSHAYKGIKLVKTEKGLQESGYSYITNPNGTQYRSLSETEFYEEESGNMVRRTRKEIPLSEKDRPPTAQWKGVEGAEFTYNNGGGNKRYVMGPHTNEYNEKVLVPYLVKNNRISHNKKQWEKKREEQTMAKENAELPANQPNYAGVYNDDIQVRVFQSGQWVTLAINKWGNSDLYWDEVGKLAKFNDETRYSSNYIPDFSDALKFRSPMKHPAEDPNLEGYEEGLRHAHNEDGSWKWVADGAPDGAKPHRNTPTSPFGYKSPFFRRNNISRKIRDNYTPISYSINPNHVSPFQQNEIAEGEAPQQGGTIWDKVKSYGADMDVRIDKFIQHTNYSPETDLPVNAFQNQQWVGIITEWLQTQKQGMVEATNSKNKESQQKISTAVNQLIQDVTTYSGKFLDWLDRNAGDQAEGNAGGSVVSKGSMKDEKFIGDITFMGDQNTTIAVGDDGKIGIKSYGLEEVKYIEDLDDNVFAKDDAGYAMFLEASSVLQKDAEAGKPLNENIVKGHADQLLTNKDSILSWAFDPLYGQSWISDFAQGNPDKPFDVFMPESESFDIDYLTDEIHGWLGNKLKEAYEKNVPKQPEQKGDAAQGIMDETLATVDKEKESKEGVYSEGGEEQQGPPQGPPQEEAMAQGPPPQGPPMAYKENPKITRDIMRRYKTRKLNKLNE